LKGSEGEQLCGKDAGERPASDGDSQRVVGHLSPGAEKGRREGHPVNDWVFFLKTLYVLSLLARVHDDIIVIPPQ